MPPLTPRRSRMAGCGRLLPVLVLDLAGGDFLERDREVVLRAGLDHRRRELVERPLAEVVVVRVDLPRALGGDENGRVVGVDVLEELVEARRDHAFECRASLTTRSNSAAASSSRSLQMTRPNSSLAASSSRAVSRRAWTWSCVS